MAPSRVRALQELQQAMGENFKDFLISGKNGRQVRLLGDAIPKERNSSGNIFGSH